MDKIQLCAISSEPVGSARHYSRPTREERKGRGSEGQESGLN